MGDILLLSIVTISKHYDDIFFSSHDAGKASEDHCNGCKSKEANKGLNNKSGYAGNCRDDI